MFVGFGATRIATGFRRTKKFSKRRDVGRFPVFRRLSTKTRERDAKLPRPISRPTFIPLNLSSPPPTRNRRRGANALPPTHKTAANERRPDFQRRFFASSIVPRNANQNWRNRKRNFRRANAASRRLTFRRSKQSRDDRQKTPKPVPNPGAATTTEPVSNPGDASTSDKDTIRNPRQRPGRFRIRATRSKWNAPRKRKRPKFLKNSSPAALFETYFQLLKRVPINKITQTQFTRCNSNILPKPPNFKRYRTLGVERDARYREVLTQKPKEALDAKLTEVEKSRVDKAEAKEADEETEVEAAIQ